MISGIEKEFMIASLRRQRDLLSGLVLQLKTKPEIDEGAWFLYDQITVQVEQNLKELEKLRRECFESIGFSMNHSFDTTELKEKEKTKLKTRRFKS